MDVVNEYLKLINLTPSVENTEEVEFNSICDNELDNELDSISQSSSHISAYFDANKFVEENQINDYKLGIELSELGDYYDLQKQNAILKEMFSELNEKLVIYFNGKQTAYKYTDVRTCLFKIKELNKKFAKDVLKYKKDLESEY